MKKLNNKELATFCSQLAMIIRSGISTTEGIYIMSEDLGGMEGGKLLSDLYNKMETQYFLYEAMKETGMFPAYVCHMTEIGEKSGRLDEVMEGLADHYERQEELQQSIRGALLYPALMLGLMTVIVMILMIKVMPIFQSVFEQLGTGLTGVAGRIMQIGTVCSRYGIVLVVLMLLLIGLVVYFALYPKGQQWIRRKAAKSRLFGSISEKLAYARIADAMNLCIRSGLDLDESLEMAQQLTEHEEASKKLQECRDLIRDGAMFEEAVAQTKLFTGLYGKMIAIGIRTGSVDQVMGKIAKQYEDEVTQSLQHMVTIIEPTLVAILSLVVGLILLSVMLPLMGIMSNMG